MANLFTERVRIPTGLDCNESCKFCYYHDKLNTQRYSEQEMIQKIHFAHRHGIKDLDFSGGEPTLRKDLPDLIALSKSLGFRRICVITNGSKIKDTEYIKKLVDQGLNEVLLSIHGYNDETHDLAVGRKGSFSGIEKAICNIKKFNLRFRTNTVISALNFDCIDKIAGYLVTLSPIASNFICFNDWNRAASLTGNLACRYSEVSEPLCRAIDIMSPVISKVTVRYIPYCFMLGYEKYVCNILQNEYDPDEWIDSIKHVLTFQDLVGEKARRYYKSLYQWFRQYPDEALRDIRADYKDSELSDPDIFLDLKREYVRLAHKVDNAYVRSKYRKAEDCQQCSRFDICDGLEATYADIIGCKELKPVLGDKISDCMFFRAGYSQDWL
ncbi:MAG: radical SAM protein [Candidatus Omnitrophica bacterium]|nr:radical SAM protein [Candidatus Omnitrophota bacterium]